MKLTALGTGGFFTINNFHTNFLLEEGDESMLIDCGTDIKRSMDALGKDPKRIKYVYVSHEHGDHAGGLEWLGFYSYFVTKEKVYLSTYKYMHPWRALENSMCNVTGKSYMELNDYFFPEFVQDAYKEKDNPAFDAIGGLRFELAKTKHIKDPECHSYGLIFNTMIGNIWITSDTMEINQADEEGFLDDESLWNDTWTKGKNKDGKIPDYIEAMVKRFQTSDMVFHDCDIQGITDVHAHYKSLLKLPSIIRKKIHLVHYSDSFTSVNAVKDGFAGFVKPGDSWEF